MDCRDYFLKGDLGGPDRPSSSEIIASIRLAVRAMISVDRGFFGSMPGFQLFYGEVDIW